MRVYVNVGDYGRNRYGIVMVEVEDGDRYMGGGHST